MDDGCTKFRVYNSQSCGGSIIKIARSKGSIKSIQKKYVIESVQKRMRLLLLLLLETAVEGKKDQEIYPQNGYAVLDETTMNLATQISKELEELQKDVTHHEAAAGLQSRCSPLKDALEVDSVFADGHLRQAQARKSKHAKEPQQGITQIEVPSPSVRLQGSREQYRRGVAAGEGLEADDADVLDFWAPPPRTPPPMRDPSTT